ncbi:MAG: class I SAM-dependent methyltransferase [Gaiellaceae bacterium]
MTLPQRGARLTTTLVVSQPSVWRFLRRPFRGYFTLLAPRWDRITTAGDLAALNAALADVSPPRRALDVGTGTGAAAFLVAERFPETEVIGVDLSPAMVAAAEAKTPPQLVDRVRFLTADAAQLPLPAASCDLVTVANMIPFFDELARVLAPAGTLLVAYAEGAETPIYVPPKRLRAELGQRGLTHFADFTAGAATCLLVRRDT